MAVAGKYSIKALLGALLLFAGCVSETLSECPDTGYSLLFRYPGNGTSDIFPSRIDHTALYLYDSGGRLVISRNLDRSALEAFQGVRLHDLGPGEYTVVCWGNLARYSAVGGEESLTGGRITQAQYSEGERVTGFDSLYYGSRTLYINPGSGGSDTLEFVSAHINMEIFIAGYGALPADGQELIELGNVPVGYNFTMGTIGETTRVYPAWDQDTETGIITSGFRLPRFPDDTDIFIDTLATDGTTRAAIGLAELLARYGISVKGVNEVTVPVYILFRESGFYVTVEGWDTTPVEPVR